MTERVQDLFRRYHGWNLDNIERLDERDLRYLRDLALRHRRGEQRARAMRLLVSARAPDAATVLKRVLEDSENDVSIRAIAAKQLARIGGSYVEGILVAAFRLVGEPAILLRISQALAIIGGTAALSALREVEHVDPGVRRQAGFSRAVVACRLGVNDLELPILAEDNLLWPDPERAWSLTIEPIQPTAPHPISLFDNYGVSLSSISGWRIRCGLMRMAVAFNTELMHEDIIARAPVNPLLVGLVSDRALDAETYRTRWLLLSWPADKSSAHLGLYRPSGRAIMFGRARIKGQAADFELVTVAGPGNVPASLRGRFDGKHWGTIQAVSERARSALVSRSKLEPEPLSRLAATKLGMRR